MRGAEYKGRPHNRLRHRFETSKDIDIALAKQETKVCKQSEGIAAVNVRYVNASVEGVGPQAVIAVLRRSD